MDTEKRFEKAIEDIMYIHNIDHAPNCVIEIAKLHREETIRFHQWIMDYDYRWSVKYNSYAKDGNFNNENYNAIQLFDLFNQSKPI